MKKLIGIFILLLAFALLIGHSQRLCGLKYQHMAEAALKQKAYKYSMTYAYIGLQHNPYNVTLNSYIGVSLAKTGDYVPAMYYLKKYLKYNPYEPNALNNMGLCETVMKTTKRRTQ